MLVSLTKAQFESTEWLASFEAGAWKEDVVSESSINAFQKAHLKKLLSDTPNTGKILMRDVFLSSLGIIG